ncbi:Autophagy-related protein 27 [Nakaseomyces glabratus]|nr:Autophagy-related protein 27 [Nakaseomyces glabratus]
MLLSCLLLLLSCLPIKAAKAEDNEKPFCAVMNPLTGTYIDLSQLSTSPNEEFQMTQRRNNKKTKSNKTRWLVKDWEGKTNFTLSVCSSPVVSKEEKDQLSNTTGAFYVVNDTEHGNTMKYVSIGDFSSEPRLTGIYDTRVLTLKYENGSMCPNGKDRKATLLNFICDKTVSSKAQISYVGNLHECSYFFEIRSVYACPTSNKTNEVNVYGIFISIIVIFFMVEYACRKWLFKDGSVKSVRLHDNYSSSTTSFARDDMRWEMNRHNRSLWKTIPMKVFGGTFRFVGSVVGGLLTKNNSRAQYSAVSTNQQSAFYRDMEEQNDILDSLDTN